ncbi:hypothetical protein CLCR_07707 [Cladophialophora carrionii]|uniref:Uncharacterized protein n=1 Tax=Cladophialophora carrionii TaxID=86049 RepID=A0A1C1CNL2_9EURO|nr:hypothetical protein CLCR_07707 [Cladophialophora carrionii]
MQRRRHATPRHATPRHATPRHTWQIRSGSWPFIYFRLEKSPSTRHVCSSATFEATQLNCVAIEWDLSAKQASERASEQAGNQASEQAGRRVGKKVRKRKTHIDSTSPDNMKFKGALPTIIYLLASHGR